MRLAAELTSTVTSAWEALQTAPSEGVSCWSSRAIEKEVLSSRGTDMDEEQKETLTKQMQLRAKAFVFKDRTYSVVPAGLVCWS